MSETVDTTALVTGTVTAGLIAGIFFCFSTAIMPGLAGTDDRTFVHAMQEVNKAILNPVFLLLFVAPMSTCGPEFAAPFRLARLIWSTRDVSGRRPPGTGRGAGRTG